MTLSAIFKKAKTSLHQLNSLAHTDLKTNSNIRPRHIVLLIESISVGFHSETIDT